MEFIEKNNLLINDQYGCALVLGKILTAAPFKTSEGVTPKDPQCGKCNVCVNVCPTMALHGTTWNIAIKREEMIIRKLCTCCLKCMIWCPYTERYANSAG